MSPCESWTWVFHHMPPWILRKHMVTYSMAFRLYRSLLQTLAISFVAEESYYRARPWMGSVRKYFALPESKPQPPPAPAEIRRQQEPAKIEAALQGGIGSFKVTLPDLPLPLTPAFSLKAALSSQAFAPGNGYTESSSACSFNCTDAKHLRTWGKMNWIRQRHHIPLTKVCCKLRSLAHFKTNDTNTHFSEGHQDKGQNWDPAVRIQALFWSLTT